MTPQAKSNDRLVFLAYSPLGLASDLMGGLSIIYVYAWA